MGQGRAKATAHDFDTVRISFTDSYVNDGEGHLIQKRSGRNWKNLAYCTGDFYDDDQAVLGKTGQYRVLPCATYTDIDGNLQYIKAKKYSKTIKRAPALNKAVIAVEAPAGVARTLKVTWEAIAGADYYQVSISTSKKRTAYASRKCVNTQFQKAGLKSKRTYYVKVRAVKKVTRSGKTKTYYGAWSTRTKIRTN